MREQLHLIDDGSFCVRVADETFGQQFHGGDHPFGCFRCNDLDIVIAMNKKNSIGCLVRIRCYTY